MELVVARADAVENALEQLDQRYIARADSGTGADDGQIGGVHGTTLSSSGVRSCAANVQPWSISGATRSSSASVGSKPARVTIVRIWSGRRLAIAEP